MSAPKVMTSYATPSLGRHPSHTLKRKLTAIASAGFDGVELGFDDLLLFARDRLEQPDIAPTDYDALCDAAAHVRRICEAKSLTILVLQPFGNFEGYEGDKRDAAFERARGWARILDALGCDMLQVGSNDDPESSASHEQIAADLAELADMLHPKRVAYENWCWGAHVNTWADCYDVITLANRDNLGLCLDTFQTAGKEWADPTAATGMIPDADVVYEESLERLRSTVPKEKIFFFQISDAYRMDPPLEPVGDDGTPARARWSHGFRPVPYKGGYLPVYPMVETVLKLGFRGWFSVEVFLEDEHAQEWKAGLDQTWTKEAMESVHKLLIEYGSHQ